MYRSPTDWLIYSPEDPGNGFTATSDAIIMRIVRPGSDE